MNIGKVSFSWVLILIFLGGGLAYPERSSRHADPLAAISMGGAHKKTTTKRRSTHRRKTKRYTGTKAKTNSFQYKKPSHNTFRKQTTNNANRTRSGSRKAKQHTSSPKKSAVEYDIQNAEVATDIDYIDKTLMTPEEIKILEKRKIEQKRRAVQASKREKKPQVDKSKPSDKKISNISFVHIGDDIGSESPSGDMLRALFESQKHPDVLPKKNQSRGKKYLYLTFDDGPCGGSANLIRLLREENVKATMFYIGKNVARSPALFGTALSMPNLLVANHTYTHANGHYRRFYTGTTQNVVDDIGRAQRVIGGAKYLRLAGRNVWRLPRIRKDDKGIKSSQRKQEVPKYDALENRGYFIYGWDVEWHFSHKNQRPVFGGEEMARRVNLVYSKRRHLTKRNKMVLLAHDYMWRTPHDIEQLKIFLDIMKAQNWTFETIDSYTNKTPAVLALSKKKSTTAKKKILKPAQRLAHKASILQKQTTKKQKIAKVSKRAQKISIATRLNNSIYKQNFVDIRKLLSHGANINGKDSKGRIPLNVAVETNNAVLVKMLVDRGARIFNMDDRGMSPMGIAMQHQNTVIINYLKKQIEKNKKFKLNETMFSM